MRRILAEIPQGPPATNLSLVGLVVVPLPEMNLPEAKQEHIALTLNVLEVTKFWSYQGRYPRILTS